MERVIKKFNSFEEQEQWQLEYTAKLTPVERLQKLRKLQKVINKINSSIEDSEKKILKRNGFI